MAQHDQVIANDSGANVRADINAALAALFGLSSGATAPTTTIAYMLWADTTTGLLKIRDAANTGWVTLGTLAESYGDSELAAIAGLTSAADRLPYFTGSGTASLATFTAFARTLLDDADAATALATLGALALAGGTLSGELIIADQLLTRAYIKDYGLVEAANAAATGSVGVDLENGNEHHLTLTGNITALTISNWPATGRRGKLTLYLKQGGSGSYTVTWPAAVDWGDAGAPTLSTAVGDTDIVVLTTNDAGTNIFAMLAGKGFV